jgi:4-hydroxy-4-methyl-2-oxoglutarate aldolase
MQATPFPPELLKQYRQLSTCVVASAIEAFDVRLRNVGYADSRVHCVFPDLPNMVGYAATARIRSADPPMEGPSYYFRTDWWASFSAIPAPRVVVIQDVDSPPGLGAFVGEVHAFILQALGCVGLLTNGGVRDLPQVKASGFQMFAGNVCVSHAYAHVFDFGGSVEVGGLKVNPGDLIQGDLHGVQTIPHEIAERVPKAAQEILQKRQQLKSICCSPKFSVEELSRKIEEYDSRQKTEH